MGIIIGSHVSYNKKEGLYGCVNETLKYGANAFMFYTGAPQNTNRSQIDDELTLKAYNLMEETNIDKENVIVHAPYIINLANNTSEEKYLFSINFLKDEIKRCKQLGVYKMVLHPGNALKLSKEEAILNIANALNVILEEEDNFIICLETMAGKGSEVGTCFEELKMIMDNVNKKDLIGVCMDTCHLNDAGYDLNDFDKVLDEFDKIIGLSKLYCIHLNDSYNIINAKKDRHSNIGFGTIGYDNLIDIVYNTRVENIMKILETPYITKDDESKERLYSPYKEEIAMIKDKNFDENMISKIREMYN